MDLVEGRFYVIQVLARCIQDYPRFVKRYMGNVTVRYTGSYQCNGKVSCVFEHVVPNGHYLRYGVWMMAAANHVGKVFNEWTTHIYSDRFAVRKDITGVIKRAVERFKALKARRVVLVLRALEAGGLGGDLRRKVFGTLYGRVFV